MKRLIRYYERHSESLRRYYEKQLEDIRILEIGIGRLKERLNSEEATLIESAEFIDKAKDAIAQNKRWWIDKVECIRSELCVSKDLAYITTLKIVHDDAVRRIESDVRKARDENLNRKLNRKFEERVGLVFWCIVFVVSAILGTIEIIRCCD